MSSSFTSFSAYGLCSTPFGTTNISLAEIFTDPSRIYTTGERRPDNWDAGSWRWKSTRSDEASGTSHGDIDGNEIVTLIAPGPKDIVIKKQKPSGFFGTNLASYLTLLGCDSVIIVGTTTSGCVRATVVDAYEFLTWGFYTLHTTVGSILNLSQIGAFWRGFETLWLPASLLPGDKQQRLADALYAASRHWSFEIQFDKGLAGAPDDALAASRDTATKQYDPMYSVESDSSCFLRLAPKPRSDRAGEPTRPTQLDDCDQGGISLKSDEGTAHINDLGRHGHLHRLLRNDDGVTPSPRP